MTVQSRKNVLIYCTIVKKEETVYLTVLSRESVLIKTITFADSIASRKRTIQIQLWNHIVSLRKNVLCSHITSRSCRAETRSRRKQETRIRSRKTNSVEDIWFFRILIDLIFWQILVKSKKLDFALFASMYARNACRAFDALFFLSISRSFFVCLTSLTYFMNFLQSNRIDIRSLMSQEVSENSETQWCYQIMMWFALSSISHYSDTRYLLHDVFSSQF